MAQVIHKYADLVVGDIVTLKSGSPDMTVIGFNPAEPKPDMAAAAAHGALLGDELPNVHVAWVSADGAFLQGSLPVASLNIKDSEHEHRKAEAAARDKQPAPKPAPVLEPTV
jgi:uncharacterized protein DUF2158